MSYRYWQCKNDYFLFCYNTHRQRDGKFHAFKLRHGLKIKDIAFGRRRIAKSRAYQWFCKRRTIIEKKQQEKKQEQMKKPKPTADEKKKNQLKTKINNASKHIERLAKIRDLAEIRIKRAETQIEKWQRKQKRWFKELAKLEKTSSRIKALIESI